MSLAKKLNLKDGMRLRVVGKPNGVDLGDVATTTSAKADAVLVFVKTLAEVDAKCAPMVPPPRRTASRGWPTRRPATFVALAILASVALAPEVLGAVPQDDCGSGTDAPAHIQAAVLLNVPQRCEGVIVGADESSDAYAFWVATGTMARIQVFALERELDVCLIEPGNTSGPCPSAAPVLVHETSKSGLWHVRVFWSSSVTLPYSLSVTFDKTEHEGSLLLGTEARISEKLGPDAPPVDGAWIALPQVTTDNETAVIRGSAPLGLGAVSGRFYSADREEIPTECHWGGARYCFAPAGASWLVVTSGCCAKLDYLVGYHY